MVTFRSILPLTLLLGICAFAAAGQSLPSSPQPQADVPGSEPMRMTTDSVEYCANLAHKLETTPSLSDEALLLVREGRRMCAQGLVIGGVARLRRALMLAQGPTTSP